MNNVPKDTASLIADICREIIIKPDALQVYDSTIESQRVFTVIVSSNFPDHKKIIGSERKHFLALETIVKAIGRKYAWRAGLAPIEYRGKMFNQPYADFVAREDWGSQKILSLVKRIGEACFKQDVRVDVLNGATQTNIELTVSADENAEDIMNIGGALRALIRPIGKSNGRNLYFNIVT